ncbi:ABC transporter substrate-binding protein [Pseudidiomarina planktonica]|nr:ABC transporter substrate-binding protein [Pseudidiomarina planktonica]
MRSNPKQATGTFTQCLQKWLAPLSVTVLAACSPAAESDKPRVIPEPLQHGLIYCSEGNPESFNPQLGTSGTTVDATASQIYDRLLDFDDQSKTFVAALATDWEALDNGTRYRFNLREKVAFHQNFMFQPSRTFNADDVVFSFQRWLDKNHPYHYVNGGQYPFFTSSGLIRLIERVEKVGPYTVDFYLKRPDSSFLANLATDFTVILSAEYGEQLRANNTMGMIDFRPIGTGPYEFVEFRKDILIRYFRHQEYWRETPELEHLVYSITPNANKRMLKLITGECDVIPYPLVNELQALDVNSKIEVASEVNPNVAFWAFNTAKPPFDDPLVRQALSHAVNRPAIIDTIYSGNAQLAHSLLPETSWAYSEEVNRYPYDPKRARKLLADAGFPNGFMMDIWAMPVQRVYNPNAQRMAELIQADLAEIGVRANIVSYEWNTFRRRLARGEHQSVLIGWVADHADPDNFYRPILSCAAIGSGNRANYCNPALDQLLIKAISETEQAKRRPLYDQIQNIVSQQVPVLPIANSLRFQAHQADITGVELPPYGGISFRNAKRLSPAELQQADSEANSDANSDANSETNSGEQPQ